MAEGYWRVCGIVLLLLACQGCSSAAYSEQRRRWENKRDPTEGENGWRTSLVNTEHRLRSLANLNSAESLQGIVSGSIARAKGLDAKVRAAPYKGSPTPRSSLSVHSRRLHSPKSNSFESPVTELPGGGGAYNMAFSIGTPPQYFEAIADTGSDLVWLQCNPCITISTQCNSTSAYSPALAPSGSPSSSSEAFNVFSPALSSTYAVVGCNAICNRLGAEQILQCSPVCEYLVIYGDGTFAEGYFSEDVCSLETTSGTNTTISNFQFGCSPFEDFPASAGIVGLGRGPISFTSQIASRLGHANKFSYCLVPESLNTGNTSTATSPIIFGAAAAKPVNSSAEFSYTPLQTPYDVSVIPFYYVNLTSISVGGKDLKIHASAFELDNLGNGGTIFDSGTSITALTPGAYIPVLNAFETALDYPLLNVFEYISLDLCYNVTGYSIAKIAESVPKLSFKFVDATFDLPFNNTFAMLDIPIFDSFANGSFSISTFPAMCLTLQKGALNIFGNFQQQNFQVIYDQERQKIGWLPADCSAA